MVETIIHKEYPKTVIKMRVGDLDKARCSSKFISHNISDDVYVYVICDENGEIIYRGNKHLLTILPIK